MEVINLDTFRKRKSQEQLRPRRITFRSPKFVDDAGFDKTVNISVVVENGDVFGILQVVADDHGIGRLGDDGVYYFIPWPCACVEISDV